MKKITVITLQNVRNYGSVLQAFATQKIFESLGCEVNFIDYVRADLASPVSRAEKWCKGFPLIKKIIYTIILIPSFLVQNRKFGRFIKEKLNVIPGSCTEEKDFRNLKLDSDIYCTGSDQTWNSDWNDGILPPLFLSFAPQGKKRISYAASFGKNSLDDREKNATKALLQKYDAISVREDSGVRIVKDLGINECTHVLDPTLQLDRSFWGKFATNKYKNEKYVLIYQLNTNPEFDKYAREFARRKQMKLVRFCTRIDQLVKCGKPEIVPDVMDFVSLIYYARYVITDSFHATAFSINVNTEFISIYPPEFGTRIDSLLKQMNLSHRRLKNFSDFSFVDAPATDFTYSDSVLENERYKSLEFLRKAIE